MQLDHAPGVDYVLDSVGLGVHGPSTDDPLMRLTGQTNDSSATAIYYHQDGINSVVATSTQGGAIAGAQLFDAWGNMVQSSGSIAQYGYTGREPDASGLIYYRARYYDPTIGRFISRDPAGMPDGVNQYAYANNNPVNFTDPSGLVRWGDAFRAGVNLVSNGAGIFVGSVITAAGAGLLAAPEPVMTKLAGVGAVTFGGTIYTKSVAGAGMSANNLISAIQDRPASMPSSAAEWVAGKISPGNKTAQKTAQILDLGLDLASGRVNPAKMIVLKPGEGIPRLKWGTAGDKIEREYGSAGKAFNTASDWFQGLAAADSIINSGMDISRSLNLNNYFSNMQGTGGSGSQTLLGTSPRN